MRSLRIAVTGATGFTGERLVHRLRRDGHRVTAIVRGSSRRDRIADAVAGFSVADLRRPADVEAALKGHDALIHVASMGFEEAPAYVAAIERARIPRAVFTSTTSILTRLPVQSKPVRIAAERAVRDSAISWTIIRPTMIYGSERDRNISRLLRFVHRYRFMALPGGGTAAQQPVHVDDVADAAACALATDAAALGTYNLSGAHPLSFRQLVEAAGIAVGVRPLMIPVPVGALAMPLRLTERLGVPVSLRPEQILRVAENKAFDHSDASRDFGFRPRSFGEGVVQEARLLGIAPGATC
jgi:uncharacterized protein YbjT (DUF2867 family)